MMRSSGLKGKKGGQSGWRAKVMMIMTMTEQTGQPAGAVHLNHSRVIVSFFLYLGFLKVLS